MNAMRCAFVAVLWALCTVAQAQALAPAALRDPTLPPAGAAAGSPEDALGAGAAAAGLPGANVVVREGKSYLVVGSRLVAPGQMVESSKLERITETEVWWRDANGITKVPRYAGVQRSAARTQCAAPAAAKPPRKSAKKPATGKRKIVQPPSNPTGVGAPRPTRENEPHDC